MNTRAGSVAEYIAAAPKRAQQHLNAMRAAVRAAAPGATEALKWGMPGYSHKRILVTFAAHQAHIGFYPTPAAVKAFAKQLTKYHTAAGSVRFPFDQPLPVALVKKITAFRVKATMAADAKWRTAPAPPSRARRVRR